MKKGNRSLKCMNEMSDTLRDELNNVSFAGLEGVSCGDVLYYAHFYRPRINTLYSIMRIIASLVLQRSQIVGNDKADIAFLFSNSYKKRIDHLRWFERIAGLANSVVIKPDRYHLCLSNLAYFKYLVKWIKQGKDIAITRQEKIYYYQILFSGACEWWEIRKRLLAYENLKALVSLCDVHLIDSIAVQKMNNEGIITVSLQHGMLSSKYNKWGLLGSHSKYYLIYGQFIKDQAIQLGLNAEKFIIVGMPQLIIEEKSELHRAGDTQEFGVILASLIENDLEMLKIADHFAAENNIRYKVKLHPGTNVELYGDALKSPYISECVINEMNIMEFGSKIAFAVISISVVFIEYTMHNIPSFLYRDVQREDIYEGIDWYKFSCLEEMKDIYNIFVNSRDEFDGKLEEVKEYISVFENITENYKSVFGRMIDKSMV